MTSNPSDEVAYWRDLWRKAANGLLAAQAERDSAFSLLREAGAALQFDNPHMEPHGTCITCKLLERIGAHIREREGPADEKGGLMGEYTSPDKTEPEREAHNAMRKRAGLGPL